ncbi:hypothetical protein N7457_000714 [Penicillium paradoxum]|uniref:uncharacterized protein n=1 Tax=Penicillium paradoxum TaxID=176176 RepID=UPI002547E47F|nr:uncharacterized protein N7457_000714 [Penicillium paradoxum]KAJ5794115.1 hypothetical protein N7457_000714 [Penicillium paradoxum]
MSSDSKYTYSFHRVSKTDGIGASAQKCRDLRLKALKASPGSFASTYEAESILTDADWIDRITHPDFELFICAATLKNDDSQQESEWVGQVTLRGPISRAEFELPRESGLLPPKSDEEEERWQMLSLFTLSDHRGLGLGAKLCQSALDYLRSYRSSPDEIQVRLMVRPTNQIAVKLYERLGFELTGRATLAEALIASGDEHLLPKDRSLAQWTDRTGFLMVSRISRRGVSAFDVEEK